MRYNLYSKSDPLREALRTDSGANENSGAKHLLLAFNQMKHRNYILGRMNQFAVQNWKDSKCRSFLNMHTKNYDKVHQAYENELQELLRDTKRAGSFSKLQLKKELAAKEVLYYLQLKKELSADDAQGRLCVNADFKEASVLLESINSEIDVKYSEFADLVRKKHAIMELVGVKSKSRKEKEDVRQEARALYDVLKGLSFEESSELYSRLEKNGFTREELLR